MLIYLAHPYGGSERNKVDARRIAAGIDAVKAQTYIVINPLDELEGASERYTEREILDFCKGMLEACNLIIFCQGWERSKGCRYEHMVAKQKGIPRIYLDEETASIFRSFAPAFICEAA